MHHFTFEGGRQKTSYGHIVLPCTIIFFFLTGSPPCKSSLAYMSLHEARLSDVVDSMKRPQNSGDYPKQTVLSTLLHLQVTYLQNHCGMSVDQVSKLLNSESGFKGLTGRGDLREVLELKDAGDEKADVAIQVNLASDDRVYVVVDSLKDSMEIQFPLLHSYYNLAAILCQIRGCAAPLSRQE